MTLPKLATVQARDAPEAGHKVPRFHVESVKAEIREVRIARRLGVAGKEQPPPLGVIVPNDAPC